MPKERVVPSKSFNRSSTSPYPCGSKNIEQHSSKNCLEPVGDEKEWEEARCPICMEHPHNAVLLVCSSHEKGCRPYMCDTSYCHSNCFDQFHKSSSAVSSTDIPEEVSFSGASNRGGGGEPRQHRPGSLRWNQLEAKLSCPLCRGQISGWIVVQPARDLMNSKPRSCSLETCDFSGTYSVLRNHARLEHASVRPSEADPRRQHDWMRLESERDFQDLLSASSELESAEQWNDWMGDLEGDLDGDLDDFFGESGLESMDEWDGILQMDIEVELPFSFIDVPFSFDASYQISVPGNSGVRNGRTTTRTRDMDGGYVSSGSSQASMGQRHRNERHNQGQGLPRTRRDTNNNSRREHDAGSRMGGGYMPSGNRPRTGQRHANERHYQESARNNR
ncbi:uncharacterized protein LOC127790669 [Diospyros lotus]|uniref:uncharacterized protein LOC127790669 n=1 Tax=Diospyros lotus TaxID=55363 RepID=UPI00224F1A55|nr:uncharacterized protein LOC127790669 [Diospyros lotus]XP_052176219.1 uncharacterized protein LOC127790669 [Diospyros lotus]